MEIVLTNKQKINQFSLIFKNLKNISQDVEMHITSEKMYIQGMDAGHVCLFELELKKYWFNKYEFTGENLNLGVNCEILHKIINCKSEYQNITLKTKKACERLIIELTPQEGQTGITKVFEIPLIDIESELLEVPDVEYDVDAEIVSSDLSNLISELSIFGKDLNVICNEKITFTGSGEFGKMSAIIEEDQICMYAIAEDKEVDITYNIDYLNKMTAFSKLNGTTNIHFGKEYPMKLLYSLDFAMDDDDDDDEKQPENYIRFFLAPKIEDF